jgi:hypothetical protein
MNHCENAQAINSIILELEKLKLLFKEFEERIEELEKNDNE